MLPLSGNVTLGGLHNLSGPQFPRLWNGASFIQQLFIECLLYVGHFQGTASVVVNHSQTAPCMQRTCILREPPFFVHSPNKQLLNILYRPDTTLDAGDSTVKKASFLLSGSLCLYGGHVGTKQDKAGTVCSVLAYCERGLYGDHCSRHLHRYDPVWVTWDHSHDSDTGLSSSVPEKVHHLSKPQFPYP